MKVIDLQTCHCTQDELKNQIGEKYEQFLITTKKQTKGRGQRGKSWFQFDDSIAMSFSLKPCEEVTLTPLKVGVLVSEFLSKHGRKTTLKWPNDIFFEGKKCGGIICEYVSEDLVIVGLGLNLYQSCFQKFENPHSFLNVSVVAKDIYEYILDSKMTSESIRQNFLDLCDHLGKEVIIDADSNFNKGLFMGIGDQGEALIGTSEGVKKFYSATLRYSS